jgi:hypothetical protein
MVLSEILSEVSKCRTPTKSRNGIPTSEKNLKIEFNKKRSFGTLIELEPMERKKRRKTMINLPNQRQKSIESNNKNQSPNIDSLTISDSPAVSPSVSLRFLTKHLIEPNKENQENIFNPSPKTPKQNKTNISLLKRITTPKQRRRHSIGDGLPVIPTRRISFDGLFKKLKMENQISKIEHQFVPKTKLKPESANFLEVVKNASAKTKK